MELMLNRVSPLVVHHPVRSTIGQSDSDPTASLQHDVLIDDVRGPSRIVRCDNARYRFLGHLTNATTEIRTATTARSAVAISMRLPVVISTAACSADARNPSVRVRSLCRGKFMR